MRAHILDFIAHIVSRRPSNRDLDLDIVERELDQERAKLLEEIADQERWELDWHRERNGWIGEKTDDF